MAKRRLYTSKENVKKMLKRHEERTRGKVDFLKLDRNINKVAILQGIDGNDFIKTIVLHEVWNKGKVVERVTCAKNDHRDDCPICNTFWKLKNKMGKTENEDNKKLLSRFQNRSISYVNAVDLKDRELKPKVLNLPMSVYNAIMSELGDYNDMDDLIGIDKGKILKVVTNGKRGLMKRYSSVSFIDESPNLVKDKKIDLDDFIDEVVDLDTFNVEYSHKKAELLDAKLRKKYLKNIDLDNEDEDDDEYDNEDVDENEDLDMSDDDDDDEDEDDLDDDDNEDDDDDDEDEDEDDLDDDDDDMTDDDDLDDEDFDDEDIDEDVKPKNKKKDNKKSKVKTKKSKEKVKTKKTKKKLKK